MDLWVHKFYAIVKVESFNRVVGVCVSVEPPCTCYVLSAGRSYLQPERIRCIVAVGDAAGNEAQRTRTTPGKGKASSGSRRLGLSKRRIAYSCINVFYPFRTVFFDAGARAPPPRNEDSLFAMVSLQEDEKEEQQEYRRRWRSRTAWSSGANASPWCSRQR